MTKFGSRLLAVGAVVTMGFVGLAASPAHAAITSGHIHALDVDYAGGVVTLDIATPTNDDVSAGTTIQLTPLTDYDIVVPGFTPSWACVGTIGSTVYVAPAQVSAGDPRVWPGWNADDVPVGNRPVILELISVSGPGHVTLYTIGGLPPQANVVLSNNSTSGCAKSAFSIGGTSSPHAHANWAFSAPGDYFLTFKATISAAPTGGTSGNVIYHFRIGN